MIDTDTAKKQEQTLRALAQDWAGQDEDGASEVEFLARRTANQIMRILGNRGQEPERNADGIQGAKPPHALGGEQSESSAGKGDQA